MGTADDAMATAAVEPVEDGMTVGLGTGRAATRAIHALAAKVDAAGISVRTVATSVASADLARSLGLPVLDMGETTHVDFLFDGADEVTEDLRMLKGAGGAMTREKIVARAATTRWYLVQDEKMVDRIGARCPLPIEVMPFALASVTSRLASMDLGGTIREADGATYQTDNGNLVLDVPLGAGHDAAAVDRLLNDMPGVVDHGLFLTEADVVLVEGGSALRRLARAT